MLLQIRPGQLAEGRSPLPVSSNEPGMTILYSLEVNFWKKPLWILVVSPKRNQKSIELKKKGNKEIIELESQSSFDLSYIKFSSLG